MYLKQFLKKSQDEAVPKSKAGPSGFRREHVLRFSVYVYVNLWAPGWGHFTL